jgi:transcriptional regulator with XRE-family HTH domain
LIGTTLKKLLEERSTNVSELSRRTGIPAQTLYSIIRRDSMKIDFDVLLHICEELQVPVELFYNSQGALLPNIEEWDLVCRYRRLDGYGRRLVDLVVDEELVRIEEMTEVPETF